MRNDPDITALLRSWQSGDQNARDAVFEAVHSQLKAMAIGALQGDRLRYEVQPTELVSECAIRLLGIDGIDWQSRVHFLGAAGTTMRRVLVDQARRRSANKRDGIKVTLVTLHEGGFASDPALLDIDAALKELQLISPERAKVVELKFFAGMSNEEIATYLDVSVSSVKRLWRAARAWLNAALTAHGD